MKLRQLKEQVLMKGGGRAIRQRFNEIAEGFGSGDVPQEAVQYVIGGGASAEIPVASISPKGDDDDNVPVASEVQENESGASSKEGTESPTSTKSTSTKSPTSKSPYLVGVRPPKSPFNQVPDLNQVPKKSEKAKVKTYTKYGWERRRT